MHKTLAAERHTTLFGHTQCLFKLFAKKSDETLGSHCSLQSARNVHFHFRFTFPKLTAQSAH